MMPELVRRVSELERRLDDLDQPPVDDPIEKCFGNGAAMFLSLPGLRGYWPGSSMGASGLLVDVSGQGRDLTMNSTASYRAVSSGRTPIVLLDGTNDWFNRADEAGLDILGTESYVVGARRGVTLGGWFRFDRLTTEEYLMSKWGANANKSYALRFRGDLANDPVLFYIYDGAAGDSVSSPDFDADITNWFFVAGKYDQDALELTVWVGMNGEIDTMESTTGATALASIQDGGGDFCIGAYHGGNDKLDGAFSNCFLCAQALNDECIGSLYRRTRMWYA